MSLFLFTNLIKIIGMIITNDQNTIIIGIHESVVGSLLSLIILSIGKEAKLMFMSVVNIIKSKTNFFISNVH